VDAGKKIPERQWQQTHNLERIRARGEKCLTKEWNDSHHQKKASKRAEKKKIAKAHPKNQGVR